MPTETLSLRDIHLPLPIGIWPLAAGWWLLIAVIVTAIAVILFLIKQHQRPTAFQQAITEIDCLFGEDGLTNDKRYQQISLILRQLAVTTYPREVVAGLSAGWRAWISEQVEGLSLSDQFLEFLTVGPYRTNKEIIYDSEIIKREAKEVVLALDRKNRPFILKWPRALI